MREHVESLQGTGSGISVVSCHLWRDTVKKENRKLVQFLIDTSQPILGDIPPGTLVLYREGFGYRVPQISGAEYMDFIEFRSSYTALKPPMIIVVGFNRMMNPSNRCDMVFDYLQTMTPSIPKVSIDTAPFIGEPWRLWLHYSITATGTFGLTYSYPIEGEWLRWFYRDEDDCRLSGSNIQTYISDTVSDLPLLQTSFEFWEPNQDDHEWYVEVKTDAFERHNTPKLWILTLLKAANARYDLKISYDSYLVSERFKVPNLGIYRFIAEENLRRMATYNGVISYESISH